MNQRIVYATPDGSVAIIIPVESCGLSIEEIAVKDTPAGVDFWIIDVSSIPQDRAARNRWFLENMPPPSGKGGIK